jgi:hypothetical protein
MLSGNNGIKLEINIRKTAGNSKYLKVKQHTSK